MLVVNIAESDRPWLVGRVDAARPLSAIVSDGVHLFADSNGELAAFDLTDPDQPRLQTTYKPAPSDPGQPAWVNEVVTARDGVVWISEQQTSSSGFTRGYLSAIRLDDAGKLVRIFNGFISSNDIYSALSRGFSVSGNWLFVPRFRYGRGWDAGSVDIWDISDPLHARMAMSHGRDIFRRYDSPVASGSWLYVSEWGINHGIVPVPEKNVNIVNLADPSAPTFIAERPDLSPFRGVSADRAWMPIPGRLAIVDLSMPDRPVVRGSVRAGPLDVLIADGTGAWLLEGGNWKRLLRIDAADMDRPVTTAALPLFEMTPVLLPHLIR
jgi:hypothetical protein